MLWLISVLSLWLNPLISILLFRYVNDDPKRGKKIIRRFFWIMIVIALGLLTKISTTLVEIDWIILAVFHLLISFFIWFGIYRKNKIIKVLSIVIMIIVFGVGYLISTIGLLALGWVSMEYNPTKCIRINNSTVYKEYSHGIVTSSWGGVSVCLY